MHVLALFAALALAPAAPATAAAPQPCAPGAGGVGAHVAAVIAADRLVLDDGRTIALAGVEAPLALTDSGGEGAAETARRAAEGLVVGAAVAVRPIGETTDRHGRIRANLFVADGSLLALRLTAAGLVRVHRLPGDPACLAALIDAERTARVARLGLWADPGTAIAAALDPKLAEKVGSYALVAGRVVSVGHGNAMNFVNFSDDYRRDFTIMITPAVTRRLAEAGLDIEALSHRRVLVRGMVESSGGPAIRLADPADLEVLGDDDD
jgi:endonuclease YncB( thermonuclease family)